MNGVLPKTRRQEQANIHRNFMQSVMMTTG